MMLELGEGRPVVDPGVGVGEEGEGKPKVLPRKAPNWRQRWEKW